MPKFITKGVLIMSIKTHLDALNAKHAELEEKLHNASSSGLYKERKAKSQG